MAPSEKFLDALQLAQTVLRLELALSEAQQQCVRLRSSLEGARDARPSVDAGSLALDVEREPAKLDNISLEDFNALYGAAWRVLDTLPAAFAGEPRAEAAAHLRAQIERLRPAFERTEAARISALLCGRGWVPSEGAL